MQSLSSGGIANSLVVKGKIGKHRLLVLIDTGSTHTFLHEKKAMELKCELLPATPLRVKLADGTILHSNRLCKAFTWTMAGHQFVHDVRVLKLGSHDLVLGLDWLRTVSPVKFDFINLQLFFDLQGQEVVLTGAEDVGDCKAITGKGL
ncbi:unnamed protein product [Linum trigynum]|uniref:Uncharacterized protein n=1 Tax=Linum trigynum TaxID=586398 RepID=A0AAV2E1S6_9ROSI